MEYIEDELEIKEITKVPTVTSFKKKKEGVETFKVAILDTETTGFDSVNDEVIELGILIVECDENGVFYDVSCRFNQLNQPKEPIKDVITQVTGITNEELEGQSIDWDEVEKVMDGVKVCLAHNAGFDRPFVERYSDCFKNINWACSQRMFDWNREFGLSSRSQEFLVWKCRQSWYEAHRAIDDVNALSYLVSTETKSKETVFKTLLNESKKDLVKIKAVNSPFGDKDALKAIGCRWNEVERVWEIKTDSDKEKEVVASVLEASPSCCPRKEVIRALDRFSVREA